MFMNYRRKKNFLHVVFDFVTNFNSHVAINVNYKSLNLAFVKC
jgi:hypothetical protein